jgi:mevalonate kinase
VSLVTPNLGQTRMLHQSAEDDPIAVVLRHVRRAAKRLWRPNLHVTVRSAIPIASGLGSGAAITVALIRALARHLDLPVLRTDVEISNLTYEVEKLHHGTPSGIDNTVVAFEKPVYFVRGENGNRITPFATDIPLLLLIGDTGVRSSTKAVVSDVRRQWEADQARFERIFDGCGEIAAAAFLAIERGALADLGRLMNANQRLLQEMTVSSSSIDSLVAAAQVARALGAKLSGAGRGGNIIALVTAETATAVRAALLAAGAERVFETVVGDTAPS